MAGLIYLKVEIVSRRNAPPGSHSRPCASPFAWNPSGTGRQRLKAAVRIPQQCRSKLCRNVLTDACRSGVLQRRLETRFCRANASHLVVCMTLPEEEATRRPFAAASEQLVLDSHQTDSLRLGRLQAVPLETRLPIRLPALPCAHAAGGKEPTLSVLAWQKFAVAQSCLLEDSQQPEHALRRRVSLLFSWPRSNRRRGRSGAPASSDRGNGAAGSST
eukprot:6180473-Pleurochrysis_carterae.AAC.2